MDENPTLLLEPIGFVRTGPSAKFFSPHQPNERSRETNIIELSEGRQFELALQDLEGFDRIWIVWWFHRNSDWRPRVMPPRGPAKRRGVFATRSPHRPNPIGLTCATLLGISGRTLETGPLDLLDGTPVLDLKPYISTIDSFPGSSLGWLEPILAAEASGAQFTVQVGPQAAEQLQWLKENWSIDFSERAFAILANDPSPHRTRRILQLGPNRYRLSCGSWRIFFSREESVVLVEEVGKGAADQILLTRGDGRIPDGDAQLAFSLWKQANHPSISG